MQNIEEVNLSQVAETVIEVPVAPTQPIKNDIDKNVADALEDIRNGKLKYLSLPKQDRNFFDKEYIKLLEDEEQKEAFENGWRTKELYAGKSKDGADVQWVDHKEYLKKIKNNAPIQQERLRNSLKERDSFKSEVDELREQLKKVIELNKAKYERDLSKDEQLIDNEMQDAENENDVGRYKQILEKKNNIQREKLRLKSFEEPPAAPIPPVNYEQPEMAPLAPEVSQWAAKNQWIVNDNKLLPYAKVKDQEMAILHPSMSLTERLDLVTEEVRKNFPSHDPSPRKSVESSRNNSGFGVAARQKTFSDLPDLEKSHAEQLIKKGIFKNQSEFLKIYTGKFK